MGGRLVYLVGFLLLLGLLWSLARPVEGLYPERTVPVDPDELGRLNPE